MESHSNFIIEKAGSEVLNELRSLWLSLHKYHQTIGPKLAPYVDDATSWNQRKRLYERILANAESFLRLARRGGTAVGYALVRVEPTAFWNWDDTWITGERTAELVTLVVSPQERGKGIGKALLDAVDVELLRLGINDMVLGTLPNNTNAIEIYKRRGFTPTMLVMTRFAARQDLERTQNSG